MVLNSNLPFLTPETSFFTCFGVYTASPLVQEWLGSKVGLVKNRKFLSPNCIYHVFRFLSEGDYARAACCYGLWPYFVFQAFVL